MNGSEDRLVSDLSYLDYLVLISSLDAEWSRQGIEHPADALSPFRRVLSHFTGTCREYAGDVARNYSEFCNANGSQPVNPLQPYLFSPACFLPFSHADVMTLTLLDDFDPVQHFTASATSAMEDVCLAFCPSLSSLGIGGDNRMFCELHTLLREPTRAQAAAEGVELLAHSFQQTSPLLLFSKLKMDGLAVIGEGLLCQQALFRAMAERIQRVVRVLNEEIVDPAGAVAQLMSERDIEATKCVLLDLLGSAEVGTLILTPNLSVAATLLAGLRGITYGEMLKMDRDLTARMDKSAVHRAIVHYARERLDGGRERENGPLGIAEALRDNHVFRWTESVAAVAWDRFERREYAGCRGYVEATSEFRIAPGHRAEAERKIASSLRAEGSYAVPRIRPEDYRQYLIGNADCMVKHGWRSASKSGEPREAADPACALLPIEGVIEIVRANLEQFTCQGSDKPKGRDVSDFTTTVGVPVPKVHGMEGGKPADRICEELGDRHFAPLGIILRCAQRRLCFPQDLSEEERATLPTRKGRLDLRRLRNAPRKYGMPRSLRRAVEFLYQDFATLIADPFLFDVVLDLYDSFATLHAVLTDHLPRILARPDASRQRRVLEEGRVVQLSMLVEAMQNAMGHRMVGVYPETRLHDTAIDFRAGLNQIVFAADVPMKCGLGLLRKFVQRQEAEQQGRETVGALFRIQFEPGARFQALGLGTERFARLGFLSGDVAHVLHVANYGNHLHEAFHLIFDEICGHRKSNLWRESITHEVLHHRLSEIFALFLSQLFLCGRDVDAFRLRSMVSYAQSVTSVGCDDRDTVIRLAEFLIRLFLATDMVRPIEGNPMDWPLEYPEKMRPNRDEALAAFRQMFRQLSPLLSEDNSFHGDLAPDRVAAYVEAQFRDILDATAGLLPEIWREGVGIYRRFLAAAVPGPAGDSDPSRSPPESEKDLAPEQVVLAHALSSDLSSAVQCALDEGRAVARSLCPDRYRSGEDDAMDPTLLVCEMLRVYMESVKSVPGKDVHLHRDRNTGDISFEGKHNWHEFLIDKGAVSRFCPVPSVRRRRLRAQIAILKTFWDISSSLRARRLKEIIRDNWPETPGI